MIGIVVGLILLVAGAEMLVRGASRLAVAAGVPPLVIGLTVVAYGTSAPELTVSTLASLRGQSDIALGNVVGSNIFNVLFILGVSALIVPLAVSARLVRLDVPVMIAASFAVAVLGADGAIDRIDGAFFIVAAIVYTVLLLRSGRREYAADRSGRARRSASGIAVDIALVAAGLVLLVMGSNRLVAGAIEIAQQIGVSELVIGLTIVAAGTSLPELATSIVAALRGQRDIAVGNIVGSNIFNIFAILGISGAVSGNVIVASSALRFDIPVMIAVAIACLPIFATGGTISRAEGALFVLYYIAYVMYLVLAAAQHEVLPILSTAVLAFALPLTLLGVLVSIVRSRRG